MLEAAYRSAGESGDFDISCARATKSARYQRHSVDLTEEEEPTITAEEKPTSINLPNLRQRQADLIPINDLIPRLQRIALEIHRVQLLLIGQLPLHLLERLQLVVGRPDFLEVAEMLQVGQVRDLIVGDVEDAQVAVLFEAGDGGQCVVRDVEFFEVSEGVEAGDGGEAVRLDGEDFEVRQGRDVLGCMLALGE